MFLCILIGGARDGSRTRTTFLESADFKSAVSTSFTTRAHVFYSARSCLSSASAGITGRTG